MAVTATAQFGPTQTLFRNTVQGWTGTLDVTGTGSGTVSSPVGTETYQSSEHLSGNLSLTSYNALTGAWVGTLDGTITISESSTIAFACTVTNTYTATTSAQSDFRGQPLTFNISFDIGSDTWSIWPSNNSVNGTVKSTQDCGGQQSTSTATNPLRFMPLNMAMHLPFPASGFDLVGSNTVACSSCGNTGGTPVSYVFTYNLKAITSPQTTIATNPAGLNIIVDGASTIAPQTFSWTPGSSHTIAVKDPQGGTIQHNFKNWSDGGDKSHTVTAPNTSETITATFDTKYLLTAIVSPEAGGDISPDPITTDDFYFPATPVTLTVKLNCGYQFSNWTGDLGSKNNPETVIMTGPKSITAIVTATGASCGPVKATMTSPVPGSTLSASSTNFLWSGSGATAYWLDVGTVPGGTNIFSGSVGATGQVVGGLPTDGSLIFARIWSFISGNWQFSDSSFTSSGSGSSAKATMITPVSGSTLSGATVTFTWTPGTGAAAYGIDIGTHQGLADIYTQDGNLGTSITVSVLPTDGTPVYVRLWTEIAQNWQYNDYVYTASGTLAKSAIQFPPDGSTLSSSTVTFSWTAVNGATSYWLDVGTAPGNFNVYSQTEALATSQSVSGLPTDGSMVYVRLWTAFNHDLRYNDYTYTAGNTAAVITSPAPGSGLSGASATFAWSSVPGATIYWLEVGTSFGAFDLYNQGEGTATSQTVTGLPVDSSTLFVRLFTTLNGTTSYNDYTYRASGGVKPQITSPAPSSTLSGATVTFTWTAGLGASSYWLDIGTTLGNNDLFSQSEGLSTSQTVNGLPTNGSTIYVRLFAVINGVYQNNDYTFTGGH